MIIRSGPIDGMFAQDSAELIKRPNVGTGDGINEGAGMEWGPGVGTGDGPELAEGPGVGNGDGPELEEGPADGAGPRSGPSNRMSA